MFHPNQNWPQRSRYKYCWKNRSMMVYVTLCFSPNQTNTNIWSTQHGMRELGSLFHWITPKTTRGLKRGGVMNYGSLAGDGAPLCHQNLQDFPWVFYIYNSKKTEKVKKRQNAKETSRFKTPLEVCKYKSPLPLTSKVNLPFSHMCCLTEWSRLPERVLRKCRTRIYARLHPFILPA